MITTLVRYKLDLDRIEAFVDYAGSWRRLIERHGGLHHGVFLPPSGALPDDGFSHPGLGASGAADEAIALYSFADLAAVQAYRDGVASDPDARVLIERYRGAQPFHSYERTYLEPLA